MRRKPAVESQQHGQPYTYPAPFRGWVDSDNPAMNQPGGAAVLDNFLPTATGCRLRGGSQAVSVIGSPVTHLMPYDNGVEQKLFAATETAIKDATDLDGSAAPAVVSNLTGGDWSSTTFRTVAGTYLMAVNGRDDPQLFDGTTWQAVGPATAPISITGAAGPFSAVWAFKSRLFFAKGLAVFYLPTGQVGGAMEDLSLSGVFQRGGQIAFGTSWSSDSGAGFGDRCVIVSDQGEIAVYEGDDPSDANAWRLVGRYDVAPVLGRNAHVRVGGDVLIATTDGLLPLSGVVSRDPMALATAAISRPISRAWHRGVESLAWGWSVTRWPNSGVVLVSRPGRNVWGVYAESGAWFRVTGWDAAVSAIHKKRLYFAGADGVVRQGDTTGQDDGLPIVGRCRWLPEVAPQAGRKVVQLARALFRTTRTIRFGLRFVNSDFGNFPTVPAPWEPMPSGGLWDVAMWDVMTWDSNSNLEMKLAVSGWRSMSKTGDRLAPEIQVVSDGQLPALCELISVDAIIETGGVVV